ncbi:hypothetical protein [Marilutibacter chinensis]|uniref:Cellulose biosynthesis protein BcsQ n=1 Tax=Marilutibacter chinensis TaxID=2912247 RepID=A0ABS9HRN1_9GAMM|nr:hypothetical protein [Lysobacter chinensis]MCF7221308.1 hypothetical protein [Lysobacter chinensis]
MRLVAHIGLHKTGTTSLQLAMAANRELLGKSGVLYPVAGHIDSGGHLNLVWEQVSQWKFKPHFGGLSAFVHEVRNTDCDTVILSAESLSGYYNRTEPVELVKKLCDDLGTRATIVSTIRPQHTLLDSLYAQNASTGYTDLDFRSYVTKTLTQRSLELEVLLGRWYESFDDVRLLDVDGNREKPLIARFLEMCDIEMPAGMNVLGRANERATIHTVEYGRYAARVLAGLEVTPAVRHQIISMVAKLTRARYPGDPKFSGLDREMAEFLHMHFSERNAQFATRRLAGIPPFASDDKPLEKAKPSFLDLEKADQEERLTFERILASAIISTQAQK